MVAWKLENRTAKASMSFQLVLTKGELEVHRFTTRGTRNDIRITPAEWEAIDPVFGGLLSIFETPSLFFATCHAARAPQRSHRLHR